MEMPMNERIKSLAKSVCIFCVRNYYDYSTALNDYSRMQEADNKILSVSSCAFARCFSDVAKQICYTKPAKNADTYCVLANEAVEMLASGISEADTLEYFDKLLIKERSNLE